MGWRSGSATILPLSLGLGYVLLHEDWPPQLLRERRVDGLSSERPNRPSDDRAIWADDRLPSIQAVVVVDEVAEEYLRGRLAGSLS